MKKLFIAALVLCSTLVHASEVTVFEAAIYLGPSFRTYVDTSFQMNTTTKEGFVQVSVIEERPGMANGYYDSMGRWLPYNQPTHFTILSEKVKVENLVLDGNRVVYHSEEGEVECGTLGVSRVLKKPTIYLSGKCELEGTIIRGRHDQKVVVKLKTK